MKNGTLCSDAAECGDAAELYSKYLCALHMPVVNQLTPQC